MANLVLKSFLSSSTAVTSPVLGSAGTVRGTPSFTTAMKFATGMTTSSNSNNATFPCGVVGDKGCCEFFLKTIVNVTNGAPAGGGYPSLVGWKDNGSSNYIQISLYQAPYYFFIQMFNGGTGHAYQLAAGTWLANSINHIAVVWNTAGITGLGTKKVAVFLNNTEIASSTTGFGTYGTATGVLHVGTRENDTEHMEGSTMENIHWWQIDKTDFKDVINNRRGGLNDQVIIC